MATMNPFDLLGDDDNEDPSLLAAVQNKVEKAKKDSAPAQAAKGAKPAKLPSRPLPPAQAVKDAKTEPGRGGNRSGLGRGRGRGGYNRDSVSNENAFSNNGTFGGYRPSEDREGTSSESRGYGGPRAPFRGGRSGGVSNGEEGEGERPRRAYERRSGTGYGNSIKRDGAGQGNWGTATDEFARGNEEAVNETGKTVIAEKQLGVDDAVEAIKEGNLNEPEKEPEEEKEMTLEEYEKVLEEKRKALVALKTEERKVNMDKDFESMQQLSNKKSNEDIFVKLGSEKDKRKDAADKEERAKKSVSINDFLKPADVERYYSPGGRGRGRGRGSRGGYGGGNMVSNVEASSTVDLGHTNFPSLGEK